ncbi:hypothetical protein [Sphingobacterium mizutaii]|uniref:hypothetical protein n=1 Tax=Sphingobacterium mizutaii TaxID=1010 RepID=UPI003D97C0F0
MRIDQEHFVARFVGAVLNTPAAYKSEKYFTPARGYSLNNPIFYIDSTPSRGSIAQFHNIENGRMRYVPTKFGEGWEVRPRSGINQDGKDKRINQEHSVARFVGAVLNTPAAYKSEKYFTPARGYPFINPIFYKDSTPSRGSISQFHNIENGRMRYVPTKFGAGWEDRPRLINKKRGYLNKITSFLTFIKR